MSEFSFCPLDASHFELMVDWLNEPHIGKWYAKNQPYDLDFVRRKYTKYMACDHPTCAHIACIDKHPIGYVQSYFISDFPNYARVIGLSESAVGLDLFIGPAEYVYRGLGPRIIQEYLAQVVFIDQQVESVWIGPEIENIRAIKAYNKAGFVHLKTVRNPLDEITEYVMKLSRTDFEESL